MSRSDVWQKPQGPIVDAAEAARMIAEKFPSGAEVILAPSTKVYESRLQRWVVATELDSMKWLELWTKDEGDPRNPLWSAIRDRGFATTWGTVYANSDSVPAAVHSWSYLWTDGPSPLRLWKRRWDRAELVLDFRGGQASGSALGGDRLPVAAIKSVRTKTTLLRDACVLDLSGREIAVVSRLRLLEPLFVFLSELAGALDPEPPSGPPVEPLATRIGAELAKLAESAFKPGAA